MTNRITIVEIERNADGEAFIDLTGIGRDEDNLYLVEELPDGCLKLIPAVAISKENLMKLNEAAVRDALRTQPQPGIVTTDRTPYQPAPPFVVGDSPPFTS